MRKTLHLLFLITLLLVVGGSTVNAEEKTVTFTAGTDKGSNTTASSTDEMTKDGITIKVTKGAFAAAQFRFGANSTATFTSTVGNITKVEFTGVSKYSVSNFSVPTTSTGTLSTSKNDGTWTGDAASFTLSASKQVRATKIVVTYTAASSSDKTATALAFPDNTDKVFYQGDDVDIFTETATLTPAVEGAVVKYSSSDENIALVDSLTGEVVVSTDNAGEATITASYEGNDEYAASSASYTIKVESIYQSIAELKSNAKSGEEALLRLNNAQVTYIDGSNKYLQDATGAICVYGYNVFTGYKVGDILNGKANVTYKPYNNLPEITAFAAEGDITVTEGEAPKPTEMTIAEAQEDENLCKYVVVKNVTIKDGTKGNATATDADGNSIGIYKKNQNYTDGQYDLTGIVSVYNTNKQIAFISYTTLSTIDENADNTITATDDANVTLKRTFNANAWNSLVLPFDMTTEQIATAFGANAKAANYTGATANADNTYTLNFTTNNTITANVPVFIYGADTKDSYKIDGVALEDGTATKEDAAFTFVGTYKAATAEAGDWFISSDNNLYKAKGTESIKATRAVFRPTTEAASAKSLKVSFDGATPTAISKITADGFSVDNNVPVYNLAGQRVSKDYKGIVVRGGRKYINK